MEIFQYSKLALYLLDIRFEIIAAIEDEAKRQPHPPSRRIGRRDLATHDTAICAAIGHARKHGQDVEPELEKFLAAAKNNLMCFDGPVNIQTYFNHMCTYGLTDEQRALLSRDDCPRCGGLWVRAMARRCDCPPEERMAALRHHLGFDDAKKQPSPGGAPPKGITQ